MSFALREDPPRATKQVADLGLGPLRQLAKLTEHLALHSPHARAQCAKGLVHALELPGVLVAPDLRSQPRGDTCSLPS